MITMESAPEIAKEALTAGSVLNHVRQNRIEYLLALGLLHLLGVSDRLITQVSGVCF